MVEGGDLLSSFPGKEDFEAGYVYTYWSFNRPFSTMWGKLSQSDIKQSEDGRMMFTKEPLSMKEMVSYELSPQNNLAKADLIEKYYKAVFRRDDIVIMGDKSDDLMKGALVHRSLHTRGEWRVSWYDKNGFWGHEGGHKTKLSAIEAMVTDGYLVVRSPDMFEDISQAFEYLKPIEFNKESTKELVDIVLKGGAGSGHFGHAGRPGKRGGSLPEGGGKIGEDSPDYQAAMNDTEKRLGQGIGTREPATKHERMLKFKQFVPEYSDRKSTEAGSFRDKLAIMELEDWINESKETVVIIDGDTNKLLFKDTGDENSVGVPNYISADLISKYSGSKSVHNHPSTSQELSVHGDRLSFLSPGDIKSGLSLNHSEETAISKNGYCSMKVGDSVIKSSLKKQKVTAILNTISTSLRKAIADEYAKGNNSILNGYFKQTISEDLMRDMNIRLNNVHTFATYSIANKLLKDAGLDVSFSAEYWDGRDLPEFYAETLSLYFSNYKHAKDIGGELKIKTKGGAGSGHHGHAGRPGERGGSLPAGSSPSEPSNQDEKNLIDYVQGYENLIRMNHTPRVGSMYHNSKDMILKEGRFFKPQPLPEKYEMLEPKMCYSNAANVVLFDDDLIYCEGMAMSSIGFVTEHAWMVDRQGNVIDNTWEQGRAYFGIPFTGEFLRETLLNTGYYGLIPDMKRKNGYDPVLNGFPEGAIASESFKGGAGSGHFGHAGRPGKRGGSAPEGGGKISEDSPDYATISPSDVDDNMPDAITYEKFSKEFTYSEQKLGVHIDEQISFITPTGKVCTSWTHSDAISHLYNALHISDNIYFENNYLTRTGLVRLIHPIPDGGGIEVGINYPTDAQLRVLSKILKNVGSDMRSVHYSISSTEGKQISEGYGVDELRKDLSTTTKGGEGSGHFGHAGRPGKRGGSLPKGGNIGEPSTRFYTEESLFKGNKIITRKMSDFSKFGEDNPKIIDPVEYLKEWSTDPQEFVRFLDDKGNIVVEKRGTSDSIALSVIEKMELESSALISESVEGLHNHPHSHIPKEIYETSKVSPILSDGDIQFFLDHGIKRFTAFDENGYMTITHDYPKGEVPKYEPHSDIVRQIGLVYVQNFSRAKNLLKVYAVQNNISINNESLRAWELTFAVYHHSVEKTVHDVLGDKYHLEYGYWEGIEASEGLIKAMGEAKEFLKPRI